MTANCVRPVLGGLVILFSITTQAAPLRWSFHDALFDDGATLTGWFDFDADNSDGALHSFDIVVSGGSPAFPTVRFTPQTVDGPIFVFTQVFDTFAAVQNHSSDVPGAAFVAVNFEDPMTDHGGTIPILVGDPDSRSYRGFAAGVNDFIFQNVANGHISASPIPEPSILLLSLVGFTVICMGKVKRVSGERR